MKIRSAASAVVTVLAGLTLACVACDDKKTDATPAPAASTSAAPVVSSAPPAPLPLPAPAPPLTPETFCARIFGTVYADFQRACSDDDKKSSGYALTAAFAQMPLEECYFVVRDAAAAGRLAFDAGVAEKCLDAAEKNKAAQKGVHLAVPDLDEIAECKAIVIGKQDLDQACRTSIECKEPLTCIGAKEKKDGACKKVPTKVGDACDGASLKLHDLGHRPKCGPGLTCDLPDAKTPSPICRTAVLAGGACQDSDQCGEGLACHAGKCDANGPADIGGACEDDADDCKDGLFCKRDKGQKAGKCATKLTAGAACSDLFECRGECRKPAGKNDGTCAAICGSG